MPSKIKYNYFPEIKAFLAGRPRPTAIAVNLTSRCNQQCIYCEIGQGIPSVVEDALTVEDLCWIIDGAAALRIPRVSLCGGEPFLFQGILEIVEHATLRHVRCSITTNGMNVFRLDDRAFEILRENGSDINLSIDSFEEEVQSITRGSEHALENALESLEKLLAENIPVTVLAAISRHNYKSLFTYIKTAHELGIKQVLFQPVIHASNYPDRPVIAEKNLINVPFSDIDTLMTELEKVLRFEQKHDISTNVYRIRPWIRAYLESANGVKKGWFFEEVLGKYYCREIHATIDIAYDGGIQPCGLTRAKVIIHNANGKSLLEIWQDATQVIKSDISQGNFYHYCNACCNKFSRNMLASVMKYPWKNRKALGKLAPLVLSRVVVQTKKKLSIVK
jgi:MoaA/NifB/PqqE/SkfB family radical SAM enzyme